MTGDNQPERNPGRRTEPPVPVATITRHESTVPPGQIVEADSIDIPASRRFALQVGPGSTDNSDGSEKGEKAVPQMITYYDLLGAAPGADDAEIQRAYEGKNSASPERAEKFGERGRVLVGGGAA